MAPAQTETLVTTLTLVGTCIRTLVSEDSSNAKFDGELEVEATVSVHGATASRTYSLQHYTSLCVTHKLA